jgi:hypothetical protein
MKLLTLALFLLGAGNASAFVIGGTNLGFSGYPDNTCSKPIKPIYSGYDPTGYNIEVDTYNTQYRLYISCINEYLDNAKNDIERIKDKYKEAVDNANRRY